MTHLLKQYAVLILIVVEYGLGDKKNRFVKRISKTSLNPYCSGIWSRRLFVEELTKMKNGLNPYCSGIWSRRFCKLKSFLL